MLAGLAPRAFALSVPPLQKVAEVVVAPDGRATGRNSQAAQGRSNALHQSNTEETMFEIGEDDDETPKNPGGSGEREGLMSRGDNDSKDTLVPKRDD